MRAHRGAVHAAPHSRADAQVEEKFTKEQKRYFLTEQMKHIQRELGITKDEKGAVITKFEARFDPVKCAAPVDARAAPQMRCIANARAWHE